MAKALYLIIVFILLGLTQCKRELNQGNSDSLFLYINQDTLYRSCGNELRVNLSSYSSENINYVVTGGRLLTRKNKDSLILVPDISCQNLLLSVYDFKNKTLDTPTFDEYLIGKKSFIVVDPPLPKLEVSLNKVVYKKDMFVSPSDLTEIIINVKVNEEFEKKYPLDAVYQIKDMKIQLVRKDSIIYKKEYPGVLYEKGFVTDYINHKDLALLATAGDVLEISVNKILRHSLHVSKVFEINDVEYVLEIPIQKKIIRMNE